MRRFARPALILFLTSIPVGAQQINGQVVGTTGSSTSPRFGVFGSVELVGQVRSSSQQFAIAALTPTQRDSIFSSNFE